MTRRFAPRLVRDERPLLVRARERPELFEEFFVERSEHVLAYFARRVLDPETAFDLMAETFAAAFTSLADFRGTSEESANAWLWTIARNKLIRWRQRGQVEQRSLHQLGIEVPSMTTTEYERVEELADLDRVRPAITTALQSLPAGQREAVHLRVIEELNYDEIAERAGVTEVVVRARVSRGLRRLGRDLDADVDEARTAP